MNAIIMADTAPVVTGPAPVSEALEACDSIAMLMEHAPVPQLARDFVADRLERIKAGLRASGE